MGNRQIFRNLRVILGAKLRSIGADILSRWILYFKSQPLTVSKNQQWCFLPIKMMKL
jgi:hypothetical protein